MRVVRRTTAWMVGAGALALVSGVWRAQASPPEKKPAPAIKRPGTAPLKSVLLFPSPSELATGLKASGVPVARIPNLGDQVPAPTWAKLSAPQRQVQMGSLLGYLAFAAASADLPAVAKCLDQMLPGSETLGVAKTSKPYLGMAQLRDQIRKDQISDVKVMTALDGLRRDTLREIAKGSETKDVSTIFAAAWLRGSALLAKQTSSDAEAKRLAEFVLRPELIEFIGNIDGVAASAGEHKAAAAKIGALAKKSDVKQRDMQEFVAFAESVLTPVKGSRP